MLHDDMADSSVGRVLGAGQCDAGDLYRALDWRHEAQPAIERRLARRHAAGSTSVLYDLTSTWLTGRCREMAAHWHSRDGKRGDPPIVFDPTCTSQGCPIAVEVFPGNTVEPATVAAQATNLRDRFGIEHIVWAGDRGMLISVRVLACYVEWHIRARLKPMLFDDEHLVCGHREPRIAGGQGGSLGACEGQRRKQDRR